MRSRLPRLLLLGYAALVLGFLVAPILAIVPLSFNGGSFLAYPLDGLSLRWYEEVVTTERWLRALRNSLIIAIPATALAMVLGTLAAVGLSQARIRGKALITGLLISPMIVPVIIAAVGMYFFFAPLGLTNSFLGLILAHAALGAPFVFITVQATLATFDTSLVRAAASLGAPPATVFFRVVMPLIAPGLVAGGLFAFATSFDEVIVVLFLGGPGERTLPREIFDGIREHVTPAITAVATILIILATALLAAMEALRRRNAARHPLPWMTGTKSGHDGRGACPWSGSFLCHGRTCCADEMAGPRSREPGSPRPAGGAPTAGRAAGMPSARATSP